MPLALPWAVVQVLRAKVSLLEGRAHNALALVPSNAAPPGLPAAHAAAEQLQRELAAAVKKLESRDATCKKYKVCRGFCVWWAGFAGVGAL